MLFTDYNRYCCFPFLQKSRKDRKCFPTPEAPFCLGTVFVPSVGLIDMDLVLLV